jgi:hypothetical protein
MHRYARRRLLRDRELTLLQILAPVLSTLKAWWTTGDPAFASNGIATTNVSGEDRVTGWTDQINGLVALPAGSSNRPVLAADGSHFGGALTVQFAVSGARELQYNNAGAPICGVGTRPHIVLVGRLRAAVPVAATHRLYEGANGASSVQRFSDMTVANGSFTQTWDTGTGVTALQGGNSSNTSQPFILSAGNHIANGGRVERRINGGSPIIQTDGTTAGTAVTMATFTLGGRRIVGTLPSDLNMRHMFIFDTQLPGAIEQSFLAALQRLNFIN